jgi:hypothetical protein
MNERWKIARDSSTKTSGGIKAGDKVLITGTVTDRNRIELTIDVAVLCSPNAAPSRVTD